MEPSGLTAAVSTMQRQPALFTLSTQHPSLAIKSIQPSFKASYSSLSLTTGYTPFICIAIPSEDSFLPISLQFNFTLLKPIALWLLFLRTLLTLALFHLFCHFSISIRTLLLYASLTYLNAKDLLSSRQKYLSFLVYFFSLIFSTVSVKTIDYFIHIQSSMDKPLLLL